MDPLYLVLPLPGRGCVCAYGGHVNGVLSVLIVSPTNVWLCMVGGAHRRATPSNTRPAQPYE